MKCLYLVTRSLDPTGQRRARWTMRWKPALNAFAITFAGPLSCRRCMPSNFALRCAEMPMHTPTTKS